jgi:hypothetical protein
MAKRQASTGAGLCLSKIFGRGTPRFLIYHYPSERMSTSDFDGGETHLVLDRES